MPLAGARGPVVLRGPRAPAVVRLVADLLTVQGHDVRVRHQLPVLLDMHRVQLTPDQVVVLERDRAPLLDHDPGRPAQRPDPLPELLRVRDRGGQADHRDRLRQVDQDLLPHGASVRVLQVVDLVHHHVSEALERSALFVQHVPQDLGGHHDDRSLRVDRVVAGEQPDLGGAVPGDEVAELLVRQGLERRGVEALAPAPHRTLERELRHDRLPRTGRRRDEHRLARVQGLDGLHLEVVERERIARREARGVDHRVSLRSTPRRPEGAQRRPQAARCSSRRRLNASGASRFVRWPGPRASQVAPRRSATPSRRPPPPGSAGPAWR